MTNRRETAGGAAARISAFARAGLIAAMLAVAYLTPSHALAQAQPKVAPQTQPNLTVDGREAEELFISTGQGRFRFTAEIADNDRERASGLMFREKMPPDHGMLFVFEETNWVTMWMKNTPLSLDMVFIDKSGTVATIAERTTPFSTDVISSRRPVSYVLELNGGVSRLIGLKPGDRLTHRLFQTEK